MFYVLHGTEEFQRSEELARRKAEILQDGMGDLNITVLDGNRVDLRELMDRSSAFPFLTQRRLIIVEGLLQRYEKHPSGDEEDPDDAAPPPAADEVARLAAYLPTMPETTRLVFVESKQIGARNPILRMAKKPVGFARAYLPLSGGDLGDWIGKRAKEKGVAIDQAAVKAMVALVGNDLRRIDGELEKLAAYAAYQRAITAEDVRSLVPEDLDKTVWALVDALGNRQPQQALNLLEDTMDQRDPRARQPLYYLAMFARQMRLILAYRDLAAQGLRQGEIQNEMHLAEYPFRKVQEQAGKFEDVELDEILARVLDVDQALKTGRAEGPLALEMLILDICSRRPASPHHTSSRSRTRSASATSLSSPEPRSR